MQGTVGPPAAAAAMLGLRPHAAILWPHRRPLPALAFGPLPAFSPRRHRPPTGSHFPAAPPPADCVPPLPYRQPLPAAPPSQPCHSRSAPRSSHSTRPTSSAPPATPATSRPHRLPPPPPGSYHRKPPWPPLPNHPPPSRH
ncbi:proline-rich receptor-like protein kinase PERK9 [Cryptomeria japonica]|uniref:proline-rich receptor-like protein kinase PERK9 n=1 Tax=Cryptomeria japonica TaxID=3369 RepID=UPI0025AB6D37|nr:proline-rich receptor-like protein kinase PERK9 [Cryptomeria japonica]